MGFHVGIGAKVKSLFVPSLDKEEPLDVERKPADYRSNEELFLDSWPWLDSDCEDDFYSINGEFTPSRSNTPDYHTEPSLNKVFFFDKIAEAKSETFPAVKKKLAQLLQETLQEVSNDQNSNEINGRKLNVYNVKRDSPKNSFEGIDTDGASSDCVGEAKSNKESHKKKEKLDMAVYCCLPSVVHNSGFNGRKLKTCSWRCSV